MKLLYDNKVVDSTIYKSSERNTYKFDDALLDPRLSRVGRTNTGIDEWIKFDLGSACQVDYVVILGHNFTDGASIYLEGNSSDDWGTPPVSIELTVNDVVISEVDEEYQYWRITATDTTDYIQMANVFLGEGMSAPGMDQSQVINQKSNSGYNKSSSMQIYGDKRIQYKSAEIQFPLISNSERSNLLTMFSVVDIHTPFIVLFWENDLDVEPPAYVNFIESPSFSRIRNSGAYWSMKMSIEECK